MTDEPTKEVTEYELRKLMIMSMWLACVGFGLYIEWVSWLGDVQVQWWDAFLVAFALTACMGWGYHREMLQDFLP